MIVLLLSIYACDSNCRYEKKARGVITGTALVSPLTKTVKEGEKVQTEAVTTLTDAKGDVVAVLTATWVISLRPKRTKKRD